VRGCEITGTDKSGFADAVRAAKGGVAIVVVGERQHETDGLGGPPMEKRTMCQPDLSASRSADPGVVETGTPTVVC